MGVPAKWPFPRGKCSKARPAGTTARRILTGHSVCLRYIVPFELEAFSVNARHANRKDGPCTFPFWSPWIDRRSPNRRCRWRFVSRSRANARLDLVEVHALYALDDPPVILASCEADRDAQCKQQEQLYLDATARLTTCVSAVAATAGVLSGSAVLPETVADSILERARTGKADLIVMATHGRGPLSRFGLGSVADQLVRRAPVPVLLVRPSENPPRTAPEPVVENILIPLDGSQLAEQVLEPAAELAQLMEARLCLLRVVKSRSTSADRGAAGLPDKSEYEGYLERVAARLREHGLQVRTRVVAARHAAEAILEEARVHGADLIALATHGRGGLKRLLHGSVADRLIRGAALPILVYRPPGKDLS